MKTLLWLDDKRNPEDKEWKQFILNTFGNVEIVWVKSAEEFTQYISNSPMPHVISFDHDLHKDHYTPNHLWNDYYNSSMWQQVQSAMLSGQLTGYDCAGYLVKHCKKNNLKLPEYHCHSANPVGKDKILGLLNWEKENNF